MEYAHIDYPRWDFSGIGSNIAAKLNASEKVIWQKALPFQDKRNDKGHAESVTYFALELLEQISADRRVVIPAAILHDIGWSQMSKTELDLFYDKNWERYELILRARHQEEGVDLAKRLLTELTQTDDIEQVLEIILQHDTRKGFLNVQDGIIRDADKLWRFTLPHLKIAMKERGWSVKEVGKIMQDSINKPGFLYSEVSREIAEYESHQIDQYTNPNFTIGDDFSDAVIAEEVRKVRMRLGL